MKLRIVSKREQPIGADGVGMSCGTVAVIGGIRPASEFHMVLRDPRRGLRIEHRYRIDILPEIA